MDQECALGEKHQKSESPARIPLCIIGFFSRKAKNIEVNISSHVFSCYFKNWLWMFVNSLYYTVVHLMSRTVEPYICRANPWICRLFLLYTALPSYPCKILWACHGSEKTTKWIIVFHKLSILKPYQNVNSLCLVETRQQQNMKKTQLNPNISVRFVLTGTATGLDLSRWLKRPK